MVIDIVKSGNYDKPEIKAKAYAAVSYFYCKDIRFFFNVAKGALESILEILNQNLKIS